VIRNTFFRSLGDYILVAFKNFWSFHVTASEISAQMYYLYGADVYHSGFANDLDQVIVVLPSHSLSV
jgi:hypothetical protein